MKIAQEMWQQNRCTCMREVGVHAHWPGEFPLADALLTFATQEAERARGQAIAIVEARLKELNERIAQAKASSSYSMWLQREDQGHTDTQIRECERILETLRTPPSATPFTMLGQPITEAERQRISKDGP